MTETKKYIEVLNWGYGGFAPMTLGTDFAKSLQQVQEKLGLLDGLNYDALLDEAINGNGKEYLQKYQSTDDTIEYSLHFMRDRQILFDAIPSMFKCFKDGADKFKADGLWTDEQWMEYKWTLSEIEKGLEERLMQFAAAYEFKPARAHTPKNIRGGGRKQLKDSPKPVERIVTVSDIKGEPLCSGTGRVRGGWLSHLRRKNAVWKSLDITTLRRALLCGDVATIATGINKPILVGFFKVFAFGYAPQYNGYAVTDDEKEKYKRVCMERAGYDSTKWQKAGVGKMTEAEKKANFPEK